ncbi:MAG: hypothetical protein DI616_15810 [Paracoccus denitrificans]|uniref:Uncharacterized protein n=1 Tax=Paracoccus denitrificans TaxID=266 RepID=A0A533I5V8_PARDE|nr:MAG: hypothetical protein DI616_15810 [Paracoccus denitrificans]
MAHNTYTHMRYKNGAVAVFARTDGEVKSKEAEAQVQRHGDDKVIWLYRESIEDWHTHNGNKWVKVKESEVPAQLKQYIELTKE